jgi:N-acetylmuramoyl-L-alanine amidase
MRTERASNLVRRSLRLSPVFVMVVVASGCLPEPLPPTHVPQAISSHLRVSELARLLGLEVVHSSVGGATLRRAGDTVTIFPDPGGQVYLNGTAIRPTGPIVVVGDSVHVPRSLEAPLREALGPARPIAPPPPPPVVPPVAPAPALRPIANLGRVLIDPGHGGRDVGTEAALSLGIDLREKDFNLSVSLAAAEILQRRGAEVILTRRRDRTVSLDERVSMANRLRPELLVSVHANSMPDSSLRGCMILIAKRASRASREAAAILRDHLVRIGLEEFGIREDIRGLRVLKATSCPAVLVEVAFLSNRQDAELLADPRQQRRIARALADAITEFLRDAR